VVNFLSTMIRLSPFTRRGNGLARRLDTAWRLAVAALALAWAVPAAAGTCTAANAYNFSFSSRPVGSLSYAGSYTYTASTSGGATQNFTTSFATNGLSLSTVNAGNGNVQLPAISSIVTGIGTGNTLVIGGTLSARSSTGFTTGFIKVTFTFATPIRDMTIKVHDIDFSSDQYRDWLMVEGFNGAATYQPALTAPSTTPTLVLGPNATYASLTAGQALGTATNTNTGSDDGDVAISFAQPVTSVTIRYGNYPYTGKEKTTGQQAYGISAIGFCPMPSIATTKSSAPLATTGIARFNTPGSDVVYTLSVANTGGSPVDAASLVLTDALPANATFYNGDFDSAQAGTEPFLLAAGTSGVTLAASNVTYSSNGSTYGYTPASGYDANVKAVKFALQGMMAANSSFTIKFRAQVK
jgi:uncharacterized repeat protein (TIGR01451 family)